MHTPPQSRHKRVASPPLSVAGSSQFTSTPQPKLNVVTRLALEGKAKQGDDGATIRMYLKLSIPMDSVSPGSTVPLFPEENLKLLSAQVHPLDIHSTPYNFSSTSPGLLGSAARALHLPTFSQKSYLSVFGVPTPASSSMYSSRTSSSTTTPVAPNTPPLDEKYTGHIIVSGYNISYILPKEFPPRFNSGDSALRVSTFSATQMRRASVSERNNMHFMAAIELWIPYVLRPPKAPFLIAIPVPRCLSNSIKLRIYPPTTTSTSSSMASLSSAEEDPGAWELASEPHVTRTTSRSGSSADMADDESSDSSAYTDGSSGGILVQGTFPSTERLRVRWAQPTKNIANSDGRRRVGLKEATGDMTTAVLGKAQDPSSGREGLLMRLEYKGTCKGIWFPGVATMLGMDIGLEVKGADVVWPAGEDAKWTVTGGTGYTGFDVGPPTPVSRQPSLEFPTSMSTSSMLYAPPMTARQDSSASTSSLLRAPLPHDHLPDYSFESSPTSLTPSVTLSSVSSLPPMSEGRSRASSDAVPLCRSPAVPITIHINMNDITPPSKNVFTFSITGTVLVLSRHRPHITNGHGSGSNSDINPIVLPRFCVLAADSETVSTIIRNESEGGIVEVYYISGDIRDAQTRKTVLQRNATNRCSNDGARITLRPTSRTPILQRGVEQVTDDSRLSPRQSPLNAVLSPLPSAPIHGGLMRRKRDGPLMISYVDVIVTPLLLNGAGYSNAHAVRVHMHAPSDTDSDWLEFGLAQVASFSSEGEGRQYQVDIASVSIDGVPVRFESSAFAERDKRLMIDLVPSYDEKTRNHWIRWVKVHGGDQGGLVTVDYVVSKIGNSKDLKKYTKGITNFDMLIPTFALPVGRLEVTVETYLGMQMVTLRSNLAHQQKSPEGYRLLHYSLDRFFTPTLSLAVRRYSSGIRMGWLSLGKLFLLFLWIFPAVLVLMFLVNLGTEFKHMRQSLDRLDVHSFDHGKILSPSIETIFITTTILPPSPSAAIEADNVNSQTTTASFTSTVSIVTAVTTDPTPSTSSQCTGDRSQTDTTTFISIPTPSSSPRLSENSLIPLPTLPFEWSKIRVDFPPTARKTVDRVIGGLGIVWQLFRKAYHYPLDPP
ncbi:hypothetical protein J3R83DRAFT_2214 [Lanmaoa asiatica]|nr:hypothetical protein J3R83DRAFT_2214 [Lanmaoa asiatica]